MPTAPIPTIAFPSGTSVPKLGQGTWYMGESKDRVKAEIAALQLGIDLGMTLIDTAEMYADGGAERVVGQAIASQREDVFLVSKVLPYNASLDGTIAACERSLRRMGTDYIDLYLLHWRGPYDLSETIEAFETLIDQGKILSWGVSNFDPDDMDEILQEAGGEACATNQVLYNLTRRGIEFDLLPQCRDERIPVMAYSPIEQGRIIKDRVLGQIAMRYGVTPAQIALAWVLQQKGVIAIPKASGLEHVRQNRAAVEITLDADDLALLNRAYPAPTAPQSLEML